MRKIRRVLGIALILVLLTCGSSFAAYFTYTDGDSFASSNGNWITASGGVTWNSSTGFSTAVGATSGSGNVAGTWTADSFKLDASDATPPGPTIEATDDGTGFWSLGFLSGDLDGTWSSNGYYAAWDQGTLLLFAGDQTSYGYLGLHAESATDLLALGFIASNFMSNPGSFFCDSCGGGQNFTLSGDVDVIYGKECSNVPIPAAAWLFGSGLLGLLGVRRRKS